ncbi:hypothetical protein [Streptomyces sp. NPDC017260]|uniref:hypothetical protein n=1 Tax=unclassified Streptomyces TaxID=2593676 RepID=UPI0037B935FF
MSPLRRPRFGAEHATASRYDSPIGQEIERLNSDVEYLTQEWGERGELMDSALHMIRGHIERLDQIGKLLEESARYAEAARDLDRAATALADDQRPEALDRAQAYAVSVAADLDA